MASLKTEAGWITGCSPSPKLSGHGLPVAGGAGLGDVCATFKLLYSSWRGALLPLGRILHATRHGSSAPIMLPISHAASVSFLHSLGQSMLNKLANVVEIARYYQNLSYEAVVGITSYQVQP